MSYSLLQLGVFGIATLQRAAHNLLIQAAKVKEHADACPHFNFPPCTMTSFSQVVLAGAILALIFLNYGQAGLKTASKAQGFLTFLPVAVFYAFDDIVEMEANKYCDAMTYTILGQVKLLVTAVAMIIVINLKVTDLQWVLLTIITMSIGEYIFVKNKNDGKGAQISPFAVMFSFGRVLLSVLAAVYAEKGMKIDTHNFLTQLFWIKCNQAVVALAYTFAMYGGEIFSNGFFHNWTHLVWAAMLIGFVLKNVFTVWLVKILNSIMKTLTEVLSIIVVFMYDIASGARLFDKTEFIGAMVVVLAAYAYMMTKSATPHPAPVADKKADDHYLPLAGDNKV